ncbi:hypothetical protein H7J81_00560, partial [Mycobacterium cookii]|nr:hypothetical protein [Mycobacterium cookii]
MSGQHSKKNRRAAKSKARRAAFGLGGSAGAFLAFGLSPLAAAPQARADGLDVIIDPIINSVLHSVTSFDALLGIDPTAGLTSATDAASAAPGGWETLFADLGNNFTNPVSDAGTAASATDTSLNSFWQGLEQDWINSSFGSHIDASLNSYYDQVDPAASSASGACGLICNGSDGVGGGSLTAADGQGGGIFFGNGGNGATDALGQGGTGGDAGAWGNGGDGGAGANGGDGGAGGNAGTFFGNAGSGGNGGAGVAGGIGQVGGDGGAGGNAGTVGALNFFGHGGDGGHGGVGG